MGVGCTGFPPVFPQDCYEACYRFGLVSCHYGLLGGGFLDKKQNVAFHFGKHVGEREGHSFWKRIFTIVFFGVEQ